MIFVVQRHAARTLHYDFRLEVGGVLKSWAVPKEPSTDPSVKRLAIAVDDHDLGHATYESATVVIWDRGTYRNRTERDGVAVPIERALADGHVVVELAGERLEGRWALTRTDVEPRERWLLVKVREAPARAPTGPRARGSGR